MNLQKQKRVDSNYTYILPFFRKGKRNFDYFRHVFTTVKQHVQNKSGSEELRKGKFLFQLKEKHLSKLWRK